MPVSAEVTLVGDAQIRVSRDFEAPPSLVYRAFTRPQLISRWLLGPPGWTMPVCTVDLRVGGAYHYRWQQTGGAGAFGARGVFEAVEPERRLLTREHFEDAEPSGDARIEILFAGQGAGTRVTYLIDSGSAARREAALRTGMTDGMEMSFKSLDALLRPSG